MKSYLNNSFKTVNPVSYKSETAAASVSVGEESFLLSFKSFRKFLKVLFFEKELSNDFKKRKNDLTLMEVEMVETMNALEFKRVQACQKQCEIG